MQTFPLKTCGFCLEIHLNYRFFPVWKVTKQWIMTRRSFAVLKLVQWCLGLVLPLPIDTNKVNSTPCCPRSMLWTCFKEEISLFSHFLFYSILHWALLNFWVLCANNDKIGPTIDQIWNYILQKGSVWTKIARRVVDLFPFLFKFTTRVWMIKAATK